MDSTTFAAKVEGLAPGEGRLLGVVPMEGTRTALVVVGHLVDLDTGNGAPPLPLPPHDGDGLSVDPVARAVRADGRAVPLTYQEFELLAHLTASPGRVHSRGQLLRAVWGHTDAGSLRTVDVHIHRLRSKLGGYRQRIVTVRRLGYMYTKR
ncbi:winged helix-turn-helix domain-containing protein [Actinocorallia populi]|uniref:winged helix-turn-helix domain-containing protein n=1 Tax=Actinocorallia populi TaxID=2079200 RepID=UPI000D094BAA|nr:winged helix-turn-helix domain-containing protein [Actinocorallia populi]